MVANTEFQPEVSLYVGGHTKRSNTTTNFKAFKSCFVQSTKQLLGFFVLYIGALLGRLPFILTIVIKRHS